MFESAVIRKHSDEHQIVDAGVIAETLLFYSNVHVVANDAILCGLLRKVGAENLLRLMTDKVITLTFL